MQFIDTHAHLFVSAFKKDIDQVIERAKQNYVSKVIMPNIDVNTIEALNNLTYIYPDFLYPAIGIHPNFIDIDNYKQHLKIIEQEANTGKYIAIGEIGTDKYRQNVPFEVQVEVFEFHLELAKKMNLPVIIHTRNSFKETYEIVKRLNDDNLKGVFHCFVGEEKEALQIAELGNFYIGIGGVITFKNSKLGERLKNVPLEIMVLETDAPYLTPHPYRGKRNESSYIKFVAQKLAEVKELSVEDVAKITSENAKKLFFS